MLADDFIDIYKRALGKGSGPGSAVGVLPKYLAYLRRFIQERQVTSIVDVGCGDWQYMRVVCLHGIDYLGVDVVPDVIAKNLADFAAAHVRFRLCDFTVDELPEADLLICKEVMQHLTNEEILPGLRHLPKYKAALLTNDLGSNARHGMLGRYAPLNLLEEPFSVRGNIVCEWHVGRHFKQTVLVENR